MHPFISRAALVALACLMAATQGADSLAADARVGAGVQVAHTHSIEPPVRAGTGGTPARSDGGPQARFESLLEEPASVPLMFIGLLALLGTRHLLPGAILRRRRGPASDQTPST